MMASDEMLAIRLGVSCAILLSDVPLTELGAAFIGSAVAGVGTTEESRPDSCSGSVDAEPCALVKSNTLF